MHCRSLTVDATLKLGIRHVVHFAPQAVRIQIIEQRRTAKGKVEKLTVTGNLVVICNEIRTLANTVTVCSNASAVERVGTRCTDNTVVRSRSSTSTAARRTWLALGSVAETPVWANGTSVSHTLSWIALGLVIGILSEAGLARLANSSAIGARRASKLTCMTVSSGREEKALRALSAKRPVVGSSPASVAGTLSS